MSSCCAVSRGDKHVQPNVLPAGHKTGTPTAPPAGSSLTPLIPVPGPALGKAGGSTSPGAVADPWAFPTLFPSLISTACRSGSSHSLGSLPWHSLHHTALPAAPRGQSHGPAEQRWQR